MADDHIADLLLETQQHDSIRRLNYRFELQRRDFFKILGAGLLVRVCSSHFLTQESGRAARSDDDSPRSIDAWLHIGEDGTVTVYTGKVEAGQNIRTSLS